LIHFPLEYVEHLYLNNNPRITDLSLHNIGKKCFRLKTLCLENNFITDIGISSLDGLLVEILNLSNCKITDVAVIHIANHFESLIDLNLAHCDRITFSSIKHLLSSCKRLKRINLDATKSIDLRDV